MNAEARSGKPYRLQRGAPLPGATPPLPDWREVEVPVPDVPDVPAAGWTARFFAFVTTLMGEWPAGVTVAEWAAGRKVDSRGRPLDAGALRARFEALRRAGLLDHDPQTDRYAVSPTVRQKVADLQRPPPTGGV